MEIHQRFELKDLALLNPGELIAINVHGESAKAVVLNLNEDDLSLSLLILVPIHGNPHPFRTIIRETGYAISFGANWVLDIGDAGGRAPNLPTPLNTFGAVQVTPKGAFIRAAQNGAHDGGRCLIDLTTFKGAMTPQADRTVEVLNWRLWLSEADRTSPNGVPFVDFQAKIEAVPL